MLHVGDIHSGSMPCDHAFNDTIFDLSAIPLRNDSIARLERGLAGASLACEVALPGGEIRSLG